MKTQDDRHSIAAADPDSIFHSENSIVRFTEHSIVVSKNPAANENKSTEPDYFFVLG
ncbi:unnamed protein product, partial [Ectocarpus sp. 4 AP-2014]